jgi:hypothetical protein
MSAALAYGLSVHHFISQVGDYVGFAAIVAVAIMVLLLFAHARETADLRRRAEDAEDELSLLHEQVEWLRSVQPPGGTSQAMPTGGQGDPAGPPPPAAARTTTAGGRSAAAVAAAAGAGVAASRATAGPAPASAGPRRPVVPGAPVGVGAPALSSATKLIPPTDEELRAVAAAAAPPAGATSTTGPDTDEHGAGGAVVAPPAPPPSTVAAGGNGQPPRRSGIAADPAAGGRPGPPGGVTSPRRDYRGAERPGGRRINRGLIAAATLLIIAIVVVVVLVLGGGGSKHHAVAVTNSTPSSGAKNAKGQGKGKVKAVNVDPASVTVSVLNGTLTPNLAADVITKLTDKGFQAGSTGNAADQTMPTTVVGYVPTAASAKDDALAVARTLGLKQAAVKPATSANEAVACSGATTNCPDQVIVTVGADLNSDAG